MRTAVRLVLVVACFTSSLIFAQSKLNILVNGDLRALKSEYEQLHEFINNTDQQLDVFFNYGLSLTGSLNPLTEEDYVNFFEKLNLPSFFAITALDIDLDLELLSEKLSDLKFISSNIDVDGSDLDLLEFKKDIVKKFEIIQKDNIDVGLLSLSSLPHLKEELNQKFQFSDPYESVRKLARLVKNYYYLDHLLLVYYGSDEQDYETALKISKIEAISKVILAGSASLYLNERLRSSKFDVIGPGLSSSVILEVDEESILVQKPNFSLNLEAQTVIGQMDVSLSRKQDTKLPSLFAFAMRDKTYSDIGFIRDQEIIGGLRTGPVTLNAITSLYPWQENGSPVLMTQFYLYESELKDFVQALRYYAEEQGYSVTLDGAKIRLSGYRSLLDDVVSVDLNRGELGVDYIHDEGKKLVSLASSYLTLDWIWQYAAGSFYLAPWQFKNEVGVPLSQPEEALLSKPVLMTVLDWMQEERFFDHTLNEKLNFEQEVTVFNCLFCPELYLGSSWGTFVILLVLGLPLTVLISIVLVWVLPNTAKTIRKYQQNNSSTE